MILKEIVMTQFRNYEHAKFNFTQNIIGVCGKNGQGKTNLMDAIFMLCLTKSNFNRTDLNNTSFNKDGYRIEGNFIDRENQHNNIKIVYKLNKKKELFINDEKYSKFSDHIGRFPCVFVSPEKLNLIQEGNTERRKFMDMLFSQLNLEYLINLNQYNKALLQKNALLKNNPSSAISHTNLINTFNNFLIKNGQFIFNFRQKQIPILFKLTREFYKQISQNKERIEIVYESQLLTQEYPQLLNKNIKLEMQQGKSMFGIHKDKLLFLIDNKNIHEIGSLGQKKSYLLSLILAEWKLIKNELEQEPILLIDDLLEHLDIGRVVEFFNLIKSEGVQQVFITNPVEDNLQKLLKSLSFPYEIITLN